MTHLMKSYLEATARERIKALVNPGTFTEFLPPERKICSPHLKELDLPVSFDDGVIIGSGTISYETINFRVFLASQEGKFLGGSVGEVHGAKIVGLLKKAIQQKADAVLLLLDTGGVRLHEANAGLIAVSEVMRASLDVREANIPLICLIGSSNGCYGGMSIVAGCANTIIMSEEGRLSMSGPEVIETAFGVEEFDSRDRALVWRTMGGKHRYLLGDAEELVPDTMEDFRKAACQAILKVQKTGAKITLESMLEEQKTLTNRFNTFKDAIDPLDIWKKLGVEQPEKISLMEIDEFKKVKNHLEKN